MRYSFKLKYKGKYYSGSQLQPNKKTIQDKLESAIRTLIPGKNLSDNKNNRPIKTVFSGRTDAGVNALGQVVHFDSILQIITNQTDIDTDIENKETIVASKFLYSLNEILPDDISVSDLKQVDDNFHAQKSAKSRHYRYEFICRQCKDAFDGDLLRVKYNIDLERMQDSLNYLLGEHDFSSFRSSGTLNPSRICFIEKAEIRKENFSGIGDKIVIDIIGNRFLYNMVRAIVGTLLEIEGHNLTPEHMKNVLESRDRKKAGKTVNPYGLTLIEVKY